VRCCHRRMLVGFETDRALFFHCETRGPMRYRARKTRQIGSFGRIWKADRQGRSQAVLLRNRASHQSARKGGKQQTKDVPPRPRETACWPDETTQSLGWVRAVAHLVLSRRSGCDRSAPYLAACRSICLLGRPNFPRLRIRGPRASVRRGIAVSSLRFGRVSERRCLRGTTLARRTWQLLVFPGAHGYAEDSRRTRVGA